MRIFVAAHIPQDIKAYIACYVDKVKGSVVSGVRWEPEEKMHVTLRFIGEKADFEVQQIREALRECVGFRPIRLELEGVGGFPSKRFPRVIFIGLKDEGSLRRLKSRIDACLLPFCENEENRQYIPHITVGRVKNRAKLSRDFPPLEKRVFEIDRFSVFKSELFSTGSVYTPLETYEL